MRCLFHLLACISVLCVLTLRAADEAPLEEAVPDPAPAGKVTLRDRYVFTDEAAVMLVPGEAATLILTVQTITRDGMGEPQAITVEVKDHRAAVPLTTEGIHILRVATTPPVTLRCLGITPPPGLDPVAVRHALRWSGMRLLAGKPYLVLAMGDSVTATGDYLGVLQRLLIRATGNREITVRNSSYPGRSVDAAVRMFAVDAVPHRPDVGLLMYGLNDQGAGSARAAYVEQYAWIARHLQDECDADTVFMQPTPCIEVAARPDQSAAELPAATAVRAVGFAEALRPLAAELKVPLAETFQAIWGTGGPTIEESARRMWAVYPPAYSRQYEAMLETDGRGDTLHPNVLGHLALARAAFNAMTGQLVDPPPLRFAAVSRWTADGVQTTLTVTNTSDEPRTGHLAVYPLTELGQVTLVGDGAYDLAPDASATLRIDWPAVKKPEDLLRYPASETLAADAAIIPVVDFTAAASRVYGVPAPFAVSGQFDRERQVVAGTELTVVLRDALRAHQRRVLLPGDAVVGRVPLLEPTFAGAERGYAAAELAYVRYAVAAPGEVEVDGQLNDWPDAVWSPLGEPVQARWTRGPEDHRERPAECTLRWACRVGADALYLALQATGKVEQDSFTIFFDPRDPTLLGTPGRYYWVGGSLKEQGRLALNRGETSTRAVGLKGAWHATADGATLELCIPYDLMDQRTWPVSGDLGIALWWTHTGPLGRTHLQWSEDGHPWNPRWFGVVRRDDGTDRPVPFMVRVK